MRYAFDRIDEMGYDGWLGAEYAPLNGTVEGLTWSHPYITGPVAGQ